MSLVVPPLPPAFELQVQKKLDNWALLQALPAMDSNDLFHDRSLAKLRSQFPIYAAAFDAFVQTLPREFDLALEELELPTPSQTSLAVIALLLYSTQRMKVFCDLWCFATKTAVSDLLDETSFIAFQQRQDSSLNGGQITSTTAVTPQHTQQVIHKPLVKRVKKSM